MSPIELSEKSGTSMANISQQLRFLEMAGIVSSKRLPNRDKGQPRILYSLTGNNTFLISASMGFVEKRLINLTEKRKALLKIWFYERPEHQFYAESAFCAIEKYLPKIEAVAIDRSDFSNITITIITDNDLNKNIKNYDLTNSEEQKRSVKFNLIKKANYKPDEKYYSIYDPNKIFEV